jgi:hypothetical protein
MGNLVMELQLGDQEQGVIPVIMEFSGVPRSDY